LKYIYLVYLKCRKIDGMEQLETQKLQFYHDSHLKPAIIVINVIIKLIYPFALANTLFVSIAYWSFVFPFISKDPISFENMERYAIKPLFMLFELFFSINRLQWWDLVGLTFVNMIYIGACILLFGFTGTWLWIFFDGTTIYNRYIYFVYGGFILVWFIILFFLYAIQWIRVKINNRIQKKQEDIVRIQHEKEELKEIGDVLTYEAFDTDNKD
jgi:low affinity Fe/Cu permease